MQLESVQTSWRLDKNPVGSKSREKKREPHAEQPHSPLLPLLRPLSQQLIQIARGLLPPLGRSRFRSRTRPSLDRSITGLPVCILSIACRRRRSSRTTGCRCWRLTNLPPLLLPNHRNPPLLLIIILVILRRSRTKGSLPRQSRNTTLRRSRSRSRGLLRFHKLIIIPAEQLFPQGIIRAQLGAIPASISCFFGERGADAESARKNNLTLALISVLNVLFCEEGSGTLTSRARL